MSFTAIHRIKIIAKALTLTTTMVQIAKCVSLICLFCSEGIIDGEEGGPLQLFTPMFRELKLSL